MSLAQISLAAECITLARVDFMQKVVMGPIFQLVGAALGGEVDGGAPETEGQRRGRKPGKTRRRQKKTSQATKVVTPEQVERAKARDGHIAAMAARFGIPIHNG